MMEDAKKDRYVAEVPLGIRFPCPSRLRFADTEPSVDWWFIAFCAVLVVMQALFVFTGVFSLGAVKVGLAVGICWYLLFEPT